MGIHYKFCFVFSYLVFVSRTLFVVVPFQPFDDGDADADDVSGDADIALNDAASLLRLRNGKILARVFGYAARAAPTPRRATTGTMIAATQPGGGGSSGGERVNKLLRIISGS
jgi:hypothetical protein